MELGYGVYTIESIIAAIYCYQWADRKNLNEILWTIYGFLLPVIAFIHILYKTHDKEFLPK